MNGLFGPILAPREFGRERQRSALSRAIESFFFCGEVDRFAFPSDYAFRGFS